MAATLSWLDHSDFERRKAIEVIKLFEERGTVDELGIGTVRDAISELLFPGTSVLQPRARYFLIVPWVYQHLEAKRVPSAEIAAKARALETDLIEQILISHDSHAMIGRIARSKLKLLPSTLFWAGLEAFGLRQYPGGQTEYHRWLDRYYKASSGVIRTEDGDRVSDLFRPAWRRGIPAPPAGFPKAGLSLELTREEAGYLRERILTHCQGSLLAHLVDRCNPATDTDFVWEHPEYASFSDRHRAQLVHARNLSELMNGAALLYNLMLAQAAVREDWVERHRTAYQEWCASVAASRDAYLAWNQADFWATVLKVNPRIAAGARAFVETWLAYALGPHPERLPTSAQIRSFIQDREHRLKGRLARLQNELARKNWGGSSGVGRLSYRWNPQVRQITADIQQGLQRRA